MQISFITLQVNCFLIVLNLNELTLIQSEFVNVWI